MPCVAHGASSVHSSRERFSDYQQRASRAATVGDMPPNKQRFSLNSQKIPAMPGGAPYSLPKDCHTQQGCTWSCICEGKRELLKTGIPVRMRGHLLWVGDLSPISYHHRNFTGFLPSPVIPITMSFQTHTVLGLSSGRFPQPSCGRHGAQGSAGDLLMDEGLKPSSLYSPFPFLY